MKYFFEKSQTFILVIILQFILVFSHHSFKLIPTVKNILFNLDTMFYNLILLLLFYYLLTLVINNKFISWYLSGVIILLFSITNFLKIRYRSEPFLPGDLSMYKETLEIIGFLSFADITIIVLLIVMICLGGIWLFKRPVHKVYYSFKSRCLSAIVLIACVIFLFKGMNYENNFMKIAQYFNYEDKYWDMQEHYTINGPLVSFLSKLDVVVMDEINYDEQDILNIAHKFPGETNIENNHIVIYILSESFTDLSKIDDLNLNKDPIPFIREMLQQNTSGLLYQQNVGGGTSNTEYEVLTGFSNSFFHHSISTPYQYPIPILDSHPMIGNYFDTSVAIHAYTAALYRRSEVYNKFGFDKFIYEDSKVHDLSYKDSLRGHSYISDESAFKEILHQINQIEDNESAFIYLATMQNHSPYHLDNYNELEYKVNSNYADSLKNDLKVYLQGLSYTDRALKDFITAVKSIKRPITVVFFGDHSPPFIGGISNTDQMYKTDYFIYHNFKNEKLNYPLISPNYLSSVVFKTLDFPKSNYLTLLENLLEKYPVIHNDFLIKNGENTLQKIVDINENQNLLNDYKLLQYDIVSGNQYSINYGLYNLSK